MRVARRKRLPASPTAQPSPADNPDELAVFAAERSAGGALTIMVINKTAAPAGVALTVSGPPAPYARPYQYGLADLNAIVRLPDLPAPAAGSAFNASLPPSSITLFELAAGP